MIGFAVDALAGIAPWGLLTGLFLGTASAFRSIILAANTRPAEPSEGQDKEG